MKRNGREIRSWMLRKGITVVDVAKKANAQPAHASNTIHGMRDHRRVLKVLIESGCPKRFLALTDKLKNELEAGQE